MIPVMEDISQTSTVMYAMCILIALYITASYINPIRMGRAIGWTYIEGFLISRFTSMTRRIHLPRHRLSGQFTPSVCFMGGGQLWTFSIGVGHYIFENYNISKIKFLASSCGCFAAVPLACGLDPYEWCKADWGKCMIHFESRSLGCLFDSKNFYIQLWDEYLPQNAHELCSGRLFISVTLYPSMENNVISEFKTRQDLIMAIVASTCLPYLFMRDYPVDCGPNQGGMAIDGGFSNDSPCLDSYTITVSALMDEADIVPNMNMAGRGKTIESSATADISDAGTAASTRAHKSCSTVNQKDASGEKDAIPSISFLDIVRTPLYSRVWEIGQLGELSASQCPDFQRHEWQSVHKSAADIHHNSSPQSFHNPGDPLYIPMFRSPLSHSPGKAKSDDGSRRRLHSM